MLDMPKWYRVDNQAATMLRNIKAFSMILGPCLKQQNETRGITHTYPWYPWSYHWAMLHHFSILRHQTWALYKLSNLIEVQSENVEGWHPECSTFSILKRVQVSTQTNEQNKPRIETWPSSMPAIACGPGSAACAWTSSQAHSTIWNVVKPTTVFSTNAITLDLNLSFRYKCKPNNT